jgi:hypothetical protein
MPTTAKKLLYVPSRPVLSDRYAPPGVYRSAKKLARRWVYYLLGDNTQIVGIIRPATNQTDAEVVETLEAMMREREPTSLQLVNEDTVIAAGFDPIWTRPLSMPRRPVLVRP